MKYIEYQGKYVVIEHEGRKYNIDIYYGDSNTVQTKEDIIKEVKRLAIESKPYYDLINSLKELNDEPINETWTVPGLKKENKDV